jgi:hypothetical protein
MLEAGGGPVVSLEDRSEGEGLLGFEQLVWQTLRRPGPRL